MKRTGRLKKPSECFFRRPFCLSEDAAQTGSGGLLCFSDGLKTAARSGWMMRFAERDRPSESEPETKRLRGRNLFSDGLFFKCCRSGGFAPPLRLQSPAQTAGRLKTVFQTACRLPNPQTRF
ncbi:hypothetical protein [Kingella potus]|uniref:hypothetical protein n=1 Tax=Kingella potus TaxID=265175 RepID=UPI000E1BF2AE|nr:hypothetical protein [Kingella potus]UOP00169.1 hypothetical protein LVJ84_09505 [Kingella potus]